MQSRPGLKSSQKVFFFQGDKVVATKVGEVCWVIRGLHWKIKKYFFVISCFFRTQVDKLLNAPRIYIYIYIYMYIYIYIQYTVWHDFITVLWTQRECVTWQSVTSGCSRSFFNQGESDAITSSLVCLHEVRYARFSSPTKCIVYCRFSYHVTTSSYCRHLTLTRMVVSVSCTRQYRGLYYWPL